MAKREFMVAGVTHVDLAWKWMPEEMTEMFEVVAVRVLDALESDPTFKYTIEQAAHWRTLALTRPDLVRRVGEYVRAGRLEMAGYMASTIETNLPSGESYVRNHLLGAEWVRENWGIESTEGGTGWLVDTFGIHAQVPQILAQFGMSRLVATRFGGNMQHDAFVARGLDGTRMTVLGRDAYSPHVVTKYMARKCYNQWADLKALFADADALQGEGPFVVQSLNENQFMTSLMPYREVRERNAARERGEGRANEVWSVGTYGDYLNLLETRLNERGESLPEVDGDLNPEFTGCNALRAPIRPRNRRAEALLEEAEKWSVLSGHLVGIDAVREAWWDMAFLQFHDVFTGSHPTDVYRRVEEVFARVETAGQRVLEGAQRAALGRKEAGEGVTLFNGLAWDRTAVVVLGGIDPAGVVGVEDSAGRAVPFEVREGGVAVLAEVPACGARGLVVRRGKAGAAVGAAVRAEAVVLENEFVRVELDAARGLRRVVCRETGRAVVEEAGGLIVVQQDDGNFQIETPNGGEQLAETGEMWLEVYPQTAVGRRAVLRGRMRKGKWATKGLGGAEPKLEWAAEFELAAGSRAVGMRVRLDWVGEGARVRLRVPTTVEAIGAVYEVPFGTVERRPYGTRGTARGEWPAQRFVAYGDAGGGVALLNDGAAGVEVAGGIITTSLVRAPKHVYAGMEPDGTSSGHGVHDFGFALLPYAAGWVEGGVMREAEAFNTPVRVARGGGSVESQVGLSAGTVALSTVKRPEDGKAGEMVVRLWEYAGKAGWVELRVAGMKGAEKADLREGKGTALPVRGETATVEVRPFEIVTVRVRR